MIIPITTKPTSSSSIQCHTSLYDLRTRNLAIWSDPRLGARVSVQVTSSSWFHCVPPSLPLFPHIDIPQFGLRRASSHVLQRRPCDLDSLGPNHHRLFSSPTLSVVRSPWDATKSDLSQSHDDHAVLSILNGIDSHDLLHIECRLLFDNAAARFQ